MTAAGQPVDAADRRVVRRVLRAAERGDAAAVHGLVEELLAAGWTTSSVVTACLADVAREVGRRWQDGRWTVAQEHAVTTTIDGVLALLEHALPGPSLDVEVMVVCAEGDWHDTPARMAAVVLREHGFRVRLIGGSVPADELARTLAEHRPDVLAVSCTLPLALAGASRVAAVAQQQGIPTLAGGAGFGTSRHRARRLGLDGWAGSASEGAERILEWLSGATPIGETNGPAVDLEVLEDRRWAMADEVLERLRATGVVIGAEDRPVTPLRQDLMDLLQAAHLTALCEDPTLFTEHIDRLQASPRRRGLPLAAIPSTIEILRELVGLYEPMDVEAGARIDQAAHAWVPSNADIAPVIGQSALIARTLVEVEARESLGPRLISLTTEVVDRCDHVGVVMLDHGEREPSAQSSGLASRVEQLEREFGEGPCTEAIERREVVESADLTTEIRWPIFSRALVERTPIRAVLAIPLMIRGQMLGVLVLSADAVHPFAAHDRLVAESLATHAAIALHAAIQHRRLQDTATSTASRAER